MYNNKMYVKILCCKKICKYILLIELIHRGTSIIGTNISLNYVYLTSLTQ